MNDFTNIIFRFFVIIVLFFSFFLKARGQSDNEKYDEFVIRNKIFKPYSGYITISSGMNYNPGEASFEKAFSLGYHFRIRNSHFHTGYHVSSDRFFMQRSYQMLSDIYFLYGKRHDTLRYNFAFYAGPVYGFGSKLDHVEVVNGVSTNYYLSFHKIGLYAEAEYTRKITYDFGLGLSAYISANPAYQVAGLKLHLYFSGAFRGSIE